MANQIAISEGFSAADHPKPKLKLFTRYVSTGARILMGLLFGFTGLNGLFQFLPQRADGLPQGAADLICAFANSGYFIPLLSVTQALAAALLLSNRFVPLALTVLAPVIVNIVAFHAFLAPRGLPIALAVLALEMYLASMHPKAFRLVLANRP